MNYKIDPGIEFMGLNGTLVQIKISPLDEETDKQIHTLSRHPAFAGQRIVIMPDTHAGRGSVIGFTCKLTDKVIPAVVGVDIGCGMISFNVGKSRNRPLADLDMMIRARVPFGFEIHPKPVLEMEKDFPWHRVNVLAEKFAAGYQGAFGVSLEPPRYSMEWLLQKCAMINDRSIIHRVLCSIGSVGGGNHFVETGIDENGDHWVTIHTGSRNLGKCICDYWQGLAAKKPRKDSKAARDETIRKIKEDFAGNGKEIYTRIKAAKSAFRQEDEAATDSEFKDLEWLEGSDAAGYLFDMIFAQTYAEVNREYIQRAICDIMGVDPLDRIETVHNYVDFRDFIVRKGAVRSYESERFILPFNMQVGLLICEGYSNQTWNFSAPHGAGRIMSRAQARKKLDVENFKTKMDGIYSTSVGEITLDEAPDAYKDPVLIEHAIQPTAKILLRVKPIHNMKDKSGSPE